MRITSDGNVCECDDIPLADLTPCCPGCYTPLAANRNDPEYGYCIQRHRRGGCTWPTLMVAPLDFVWVRRDVLMAADLPESNGWRPVQLRHESAYREPTRWDTP
jgi:hypothetical protein